MYMLQSAEIMAFCKNSSFCFSEDCPYCGTMEHNVVHILVVTRFLGQTAIFHPHGLCVNMYSDSP